MYTVKIYNRGVLERFDSKSPTNNYYKLTICSSSKRDSFLSNNRIIICRDDGDGTERYSFNNNVEYCSVFSQNEIG